MSIKNAVKKPVFLAKIVFLIFYGAGSMLMPFLALYYEQRGYSGLQIGLLAAIPPVMTMIGASVWGGLADATQRHKLVFLLVVAGAFASAALTPLMPGFVSLGLIIALHAFCFMSLIPLLDNTALEVLDNRSERYGQIRLWGSIGWGLGAPLIGPIVERFGLNWSFYGHAILLLVGLLIALRLPMAQKSISSGFNKGLSLLLRDSRWYLFLSIIFVAGFGDALIRNYWFLYLQDIETGSVLMGLSLTIGMVSELVVLLFAGKLLGRFGARKLLLLSAAIQASRLLAWSVITDPYLALSFQLLNGFAFGSLWMAGVAYAKEIAPEGMGATAQGLLSGVYFGFSSVVGALLGGFWYEQAGSWGIYRWGGLVMAAGLIVFILASNLTLKTIKTPLKQPAKVS